MSAPAQVRRRVSAAQRREQMLATALTLVRTEGVECLSLARLAEASGVSRPIAYQHFETLEGLLQALHERVGAEYEESVIARLAQSPSRPAGKALRAMCAAYVDCSLENGALYEQLSAALVAAGIRASWVDSIERYRHHVARLFRLPPSAAYAMTAALLGAADRLCEGVIAHRLERDAAVETLVAVFGPVVR